MPDPVLKQDDDIILRVTATAICASDLHTYCGKISAMESGDFLGHEFVSIVEDTGKGVTRLSKGDRVVARCVREGLDIQDGPDARAAAHAQAA